MNINVKSWFKEIELIGGTFVGTNMHSAYAGDVERALKHASRALMTKYERSKDQTGSDFYLVSRRQNTGSNLPRGERGLLLLGQALSMLFNTECNGRFVKEWFASSNINEEGISDAERVLRQAEGLYSFGLKTANGTEKFENYAEWQTAIMLAINEILDLYISQDNAGSLVDFKNKVNATVEFSRILCSGISFDSNDGRFATFLIKVIRDWVDTYITLMVPNGTNDGVSSGTRRITYRSVQQFKPLELLQDNTKMFAAFRYFYYDRNFNEQLQKRAKMYNIEFEKITIENGMAVVPNNFYDELIKNAVECTMDISIENMKFQNHIESFESGALDVAKIACVLNHEKTTNPVPEEYKVLLYNLDQIIVTGQLDELANQVKFFLSTNDTCASLFIDFVRHFYNFDNEIVFPNCAAHRTIREGIPTLYRLDFTSSSYDTFMQMKVTPSTDKRITDVKPIGIFNRKYGTSMLCEDMAEFEIYKRSPDGQSFYGSIDLERDEIEFFIRQFRSFRVVKHDPITWSFTLDPVIFTIKPPRVAVRTLDIALGSMLRVNNTQDYTVEEINITDPMKVSLLDVWFAYRRHEISDTASLKMMYEKRLAMIGRSQEGIPNYKTCDFISFDTVIPNYGLLLSVSGAGDMINTKVDSIRPRFFDVSPDDVVQGSKSKMLTLSRKQQVQFPVPKISINKVYYDAVKDGEVIYESGEKRFGVPAFQLLKKPFNDDTLVDFVTAVYTFDAAFDIDFKNCKEKLVEKSMNITLTLEPRIPGFECVVPGFDERMAIIGRSGVITDWESMYATPLIAKDLPTTILNCIKNIFLTFQHSARQKGDITQLRDDLGIVINWASGHLNMSELISFGDLQGVYSNVEFSAIRKLVREKSITYEDIIALFKQIFGNRDELLLQLPSRPFGGYKSILDDCHSYKERFMVDTTICVTKNVRVPSILVKDPTYLPKLVDIYVNRELEDKFALVG